MDQEKQEQDRHPLPRSVMRPLTRRDLVEPRVLDAQLLAEHPDLGLKSLHFGAEPDALERTFRAPAAGRDGR